MSSIRRGRSCFAPRSRSRSPAAATHPSCCSRPPSAWSRWTARSRARRTWMRSRQRCSPTSSRAAAACVRSPRRCSPQSGASRRGARSAPSTSCSRASPSSRSTATRPARRRSSARFARSVRSRCPTRTRCAGSGSRAAPPARSATRWAGTSSASVRCASRGGRRAVAAADRAGGALQPAALPRRLRGGRGLGRGDRRRRGGDRQPPGAAGRDPGRLARRGGGGHRADRCCAARGGGSRRGALARLHRVGERRSLQRPRPLRGGAGRRRAGRRPPARAGCDDVGAPEFIEAAARSGHPERAAGPLRRLQEISSAAGTDWALGVEARSRALLSEGDVAESLYREAIARLTRTRVRTATCARAPGLRGVAATTNAGGATRAISSGSRTACMSR